MKHLHPGAKWSFRIGMWFFLAILGLVLSGFSLIPLAFALGVAGIIIAILLYLVFIFGIAEIYAQMAYNRWKYEFTPTNLKIEKGIIWKKYSNIPYERVQNVDISRGILARILGFSTVNIQTAGYSGYHRGRRGMSEGHIPAVGIDEAEKIRELVMKKITKKGSGGL